MKTRITIEVETNEPLTPAQQANLRQAIVRGLLTIIRLFDGEKELDQNRDERNRICL